MIILYSMLCVLSFNDKLNFAVIDPDGFNAIVIAIVIISPYQMSTHTRMVKQQNKHIFILEPLLIWLPEL